MILSQKQKVESAIQEFNSKESQFEQIAADTYKNEQTLDSIQFQDYSLSDLFSLAREVVKKIDIRINQENWQVLPFSISYIDFGQFQLNNCIIEMANNFMQPQYYDHAAQRVKALIFYSMTNGFWTISENTNVEMQKSSLNKLEERVHLTIEHINKRVEIANETIKKLNDKTEELNNLIAQKKQEFNVLLNNQNQSNNLLNSITNANKNAEDYKAAIEKIKNQCSDILSDFEKKQEKIGTQQQDVDKQIEKANSNLIEFEKNSKDKIESIQKGYESVSSNVEEVRKMMGYISDGTLSHSFNQRKKAIKRNVNLWLVISIVSLICLVGWVIAVFFWLSANTGSVWADILINGIKSAPLAFVFGFALTRYSRERSLQEEYAFRESVAATLTAYLEQLKGDKSDEYKNLLIGTVEKLYTKPVIATKDYKLINLDSKDIAKIVESIKEMINK